ncbi:polysaccharide biosynthesis protein [Methanothrix thermoacetophila PT]|uniref:Polysaccharide biosynthesis protein n=2 Tax=Methanothrix TaxID=2222 RepID=A0B9R5_METTP|nr:polysaccharide biosynthesis protein [Methanothrix thermoacetophila PT]
MEDLQSMSEYRLLAQRIGLIGLANVLVNLSGIFLLPILTKSLPVEDYGVWAQVNVTISLASVVICLGLSASMVRFMAAASSREEIQECFYSILAVVMLTGISAMLLIFCLAEPIARALFNGNVAVTRALSVIVFVEAMNGLLFSYYRATQRMKLYAIFSVAVVYITIVLAYCFVKLGYGVYGAVLGLGIAKLIGFVFMLTMLLQQIGFRIPSFLHLLEYVSFGIPLFSSYLFDWIVNSSDRYIIGMLLGTVWVGYYNPGYLLGSLITVFISPIGTVLPITLYRYYDCGDIKSVEKLLGFTIKYFLALAIPSVFGLTLLSKPMLFMLSTPDIAEHSYLITPFIALSMVLVGIASILSNAIYIAKKTAISMKISLIAAIINLTLTLLLVSMAGVVGAAVATFFTFFFIFIATNYFANMFIQIKFDYEFMLKSFVASLVMSIPLILWPPSGFIEILRIIAVSIIIYLQAIWLLRGINKEEIRFIKSLLNL